MEIIRAKLSIHKLCYTQVMITYSLNGYITPRPCNSDTVGLIYYAWFGVTFNEGARKKGIIRCMILMFDASQK